MWFRSPLVLLALWVLVSAAPHCDWEQPGDPGLPDSCRAACCSDPDCDLVLVRNGTDVCEKVKCGSRDRSQEPDPEREKCVCRHREQGAVYRRKPQREGESEAEEGGERARDEPVDPESPNIRCRLPVKVGHCRASFPRFFYNVTSSSCRSFIYGGCSANGNNFKTRDECEDTCRGVTGSVFPDESTAAPERPAKGTRMALTFIPEMSQEGESPVESEPAATESVPAQETEMLAADFAERCGTEPQVGPCKAAFQRWYHDRQTGSCQPFIYGGCKGNKNNYLSKESCMATCTVTVIPSSEKVASPEGVQVSAEYAGDCMATSDPGPCRAAFPMFYYDPKTATCQSFIYGGCRGNKNRYGTKDECMRHCSQDGSFETRGKTRDRWTPAIFLLITLVSISALLLGTLIVITLRRRRLSRRPSSVSDKEELLPGPDEQSSLESLSVPEGPKLDKA